MNPHQLCEQLRELIGTGRFDHLRIAPWKGSKNPWTGHCYIASEVIYHLCGGKDYGLTPQCVPIAKGTHWFLKDAQGKIIDPTVGQFDSKPNYTAATGRGFLTKQPSKRAQQLLAIFQHEVM